MQALNFNIFNINEVVIQTQKYTCFDTLHNKVPSLKPEGRQGPNIHKVNQYETVSSFKVNGDLSFGLKFLPQNYVVQL